MSPEGRKLVKYLTICRRFAIFAAANTLLHEQARLRFPESTTAHRTCPHGIPPLHSAHVERARHRHHLRDAAGAQLPVARPGHRSADARRANHQGQGESEQSAQQPRAQGLRLPPRGCVGPPQQAGIPPPPQARLSGSGSFRFSTTSTTRRSKSSDRNASVRSPKSWKRYTTD